MKMILTITAKEENAKKMILKRSTDIEELRSFGSQFTRFNIVEIYNSTWELIETIK